MELDVINKETLLDFMFETQTKQTELAEVASLQRKTLYNILYYKHKPSIHTQACLYNAMKEIRKNRKRQVKQAKQMQSY